MSNKKDSVISFLNKKSIGNEKEEINKFLQDYQSAAEINNLLEIIDDIEQENLDNMNQVISMSKNLEGCFDEPLEQINKSFNDLNKDYKSFQDSKVKFDESYAIISSEFLPLIVKDRNINLATELYQNLKISFEEMDLFISIFKNPRSTPIEITRAVNYQLDKILLCHDYFQEITNDNAKEILKKKIAQWESDIVLFFQSKVNTYNNYIEFFDKFDHEKYANAKMIKREILYKLYEQEFYIFKDIKLTSSRNSENFISKFFYNFKNVLSSLNTKFKGINAPDSFSQGIIDIFDSIFSDAMNSIDEQLHSNNNFKFSFQEFHESIKAYITGHNFTENLKNIAIEITHTVREKCCDELIKQWDEELNASISQAFAVYKTDPNLVLEKTEKHVKSYLESIKNKNKNKNDEGDVVSISVTTEFRGKYIIQEVFEIIQHFEDDYDHKLSILREESNPQFTELLIKHSNNIIKNLNEINHSITKCRRTNILIILNTYSAISQIVSKFKSQRSDSKNPLLTLTGLTSHHNNYMHIFLNKSGFSKNIYLYFERMKEFVVIDSFKEQLTILFTEYAIYTMTKAKKSKDEDKPKLLLKIHDLSIENLRDARKVMKLCNKAIEFFQNPQNSTMNELISTLTNKNICKKIEPNLLQIINEK